MKKIALVLSLGMSITASAAEKCEDFIPKSAPVCKETSANSKAQCSYKAGVRAYKKKKYACSQKHLSKAVELNKQHGPAHYYLAVLGGNGEGISEGYCPFEIIGHLTQAMKFAGPKYKRLANKSEDLEWYIDNIEVQVAMHGYKKPADILTAGVRHMNVPNDIGTTHTIEFSKNGTATIKMTEYYHGIVCDRKEPPSDCEPQALPWTLKGKEVTLGKQAFVLQDDASLYVTTCLDENGEWNYEKEGCEPSWPQENWFQNWQSQQDSQCG